MRLDRNSRAKTGQVHQAVRVEVSPRRRHCRRQGVDVVQRGKERIKVVEPQTDDMTVEQYLNKECDRLISNIQAKTEELVGNMKSVLP